MHERDQAQYWLLANSDFKAQVIYIYNNSLFEMLLLKKAKPKKNNKSKSKKQRTFTSSEYSLPDDRNQSFGQLFRNDLLKKKTQAKNNKSQKQLITTKKRTKSKSKVKLDKCQTYQIIPYKNSLNSQIIFSNQETKREGSIDDSLSEQLAIRVNQQYLVDSNRQLRISIKKEYQKKVQAAIKIQKVFRGYLTRKILQKYVQQEQKILSERLVGRHSQSISEHSSYFADKEINELKKRVHSQNQALFQHSNQPQNDQQSSEEELDRAIYRHHQPIYSQQEISGYLSSSQEEDFDQDAYNNHIIFETNQEYIDSRKSSGQQQQPRNKLSHPRPPPIMQEAPDTPNNPKNAQQPDFSKTQKKTDKQRIHKVKIQGGEIKQDTLKLSQQSEEITVPLPAFLQKIEYAATMKEKEGLMKKKPEKSIELEAIHISRLKQTEMMRWEEIIGLVQSQLGKSQLDNLQVNSFMQKIMDMSIKNKKLLELESIEPSENQIFLENSLTKINSLNKLKRIKADRQYLNHNDFFESDRNLQLTHKNNSFEEIQERQSEEVIGIHFAKKKQNFLLPQSYFFNKKENKEKAEQKKSDVAANYHSPISSFQNTGQMKKFLSGNIQDDHIDEMLRLREELLKKRQEEQIQKLNIEMDRKLINQEEFSSKLEKITLKYGAEKMCIQKAKQDISKGFQAAMKLTKQAFNDAKKLGYNLPVSRSLQGLKFKTPLLYNDIIIDQMVNLKKEDRIKPAKYVKKQQSHEKPMLNNESDPQSSDLQFTEEELKRFRRAQPYDIQLAEEIADMGRNVMISQELFRQQQLDEEQNILMKTQHVYKQIYQIQEASPSPKNDPKIEMITENILQWALAQAAADFLIKPLFSQRLIHKNNFSKPSPVSDKERLKFIEYLQQHFPPSEQLNAKLNQKICPLPTQLLRCMRIDFSQEDDDGQNSYQQIGKYEFIIGQDICNLAINSFKKEFQQKAPTTQPSFMQIQLFSKEFILSEKIVKYLQQREKFIANRKNHTKELRWQVLNIQLHCIFDAWNEQLIFLRSQKAGYSGIGLNQLTLSVKDHNCLVPIDQTHHLINQGKKRLINNLSISSPSLIFPLIVEQDQEEQLEADSRWIFYADQALSYGLELVYLIQEEVFSEMAKQIRRRVLKFM